MSKDSAKGGYATYTTQGWIKVPAKRIWAPHLHEAKDVPKVEALIKKVLPDHTLPNPLVTSKAYSRDYTIRNKEGQEKLRHVEGITYRLNPSITEWLLWRLSELRGLKFSFFSDQWVGLLAESGEESTWVEADEFTLAIAKTIDLWQGKVPPREPDPIMGS